MNVSASTSVEHAADELHRRELDEQVELLESLELPIAGAVFDTLDPGHQAALVARLSPARAGALFGAIHADDRSRLLSAGGDTDAEILLGSLEEDERRYTERLLRYPPESVGRMMTPRFLAVDPDDTREEVLAKVRECAPEVDTVYTLAVTEGDALRGTAALRHVIAAPDGTRTADVMTSPEPVLRPEQDQEEAARLVLTTERLAVPVVDGSGTMLGLVTVDDAMEVLQLEETEDIARSSARSPLGRPYLAASPFQLARSRVVWLLVLALAATLTVNVLEIFEAELDEVVALALFIPLLIGTGGNAGAQATTTVVRAMAVGNVHFNDLLRVVWRELRVGVMLGGLVGLLALGPVTLLYDWRLAATVALTLVSICTLATMVGSMLPIVAGRLGLDPAVVSAPFVTTLVDASGLIVYFLYARAIFEL
jgi:magnesium transporter